MLSKKSRHMSSFANFGSRPLIEPAVRRSLRVGNILVISGSNLDEAIGFHEEKQLGSNLRQKKFLLYSVTG
jgi:hypothetical protein